MTPKPKGLVSGKPRKPKNGGSCFKCGSKDHGVFDCPHRSKEEQNYKIKDWFKYHDRTKGGPAIQAECNTTSPTCVGAAVKTTAGNLKAEYIIHAVGPRMGEGKEDVKLKCATLNSLILADRDGIKSVTFPAISTGIFGQ